MAKCIDDLKKRADVWGPIPETDITSGSTSNWSSEPLCLQGEVTVEIPKSEFDRLIAIVEGAEWRHTPDGRFCTICNSPHPDDFSGDGITPDDHYKWEDLGHRHTCPYSDEYKGG